MRRGPALLFSRVRRAVAQYRRFAENIGSYSTPSIGEIYIRINKKDGSPSLAVVRHWNEQTWRPTAQDATP